MGKILEIIDHALRRKGLSAAAASRLAVGNASLIKNMRADPTGKKRYNVESLRKLADVLDLEFYLGEPREHCEITLPGGFKERTFEPSADSKLRQDALNMGFQPIPYHDAAAPEFRGTAPVALARQWIEATSLDSSTLSFLPVTNDAMGPTLSVGSLALVDTSQTQPDQASIWAVSLKGAYKFARIERPADEVTILQFDHPDKPICMLKGTEMATLRILGKVVWVGQQPR